MGAPTSGFGQAVESAVCKTVIGGAIVACPPFGLALAVIRLCVLADRIDKEKAEKDKKP